MTVEILSVHMLSFVLLSDILLSIRLSFVMLSVIKVNTIMLSVIILSVAAPLKSLQAEYNLFKAMLFSLDSFVKILNAFKIFPPFTNWKLLRIKICIFFD